MLISDVTLKSEVRIKRKGHSLMLESETVGIV